MNTSINGLYARVSLAFSGLLNTALIAFIRNIIVEMTGNAQYPTPSPTLAALTTSVNAFETAVHEAMGGAKLAIMTRDAARQDLLTLTRQLAAYVQCHCNEDIVALTSSGFDAVKAPSPSVLPAIPGNQQLAITGTSGEMMLKFDRVLNANNYSVQTATSANGPWQDWGLSTTVRVTIASLTPGTVYWARACANGSQGSSDFGGPATGMAL